METAFQLLPMKSLVPSKTNPRKHFDEQAHKDLVNSVKEKGVLEPILVRPVGKGFEVVAGERRYRANKQVGNATIPAMVKDLTDQEALEIQVIENTLRSDMTPIEEANGYKRLHEEHGYTYDDLAAKIGKAKSYIYTRLRLLALAPAVQKALADERIPISYAEQFLRIGDLKSQQTLLEEIEDQFGDIHNLEDLKDRIKNEYLLELSRAPFSLKDPALNAKAGACDVCPKRTGAQTELLGDAGKKDCCLDGACYAIKLKAHNAALVLRYEAQGKEVISGDKATTFLSRTYSTGMQALDETDSDLKNNTTWRQALRKGKVEDQIETVVVVDQDNQVREFAKEDQLKKLIPKSAFQDYALRGSTHAQGKAQRSAEILREKARRAAGDELAFKIAEKIKAQPTDGKLIKLVVGALLERTVHDDLGAINRRLELGQPKDFLSKHVQRHFESLDEKGVKAFLGHLLTGAGVGSYSTGPYGNFATALRLFKLDWGKTLKAKTTELSQAKKAAKTKTKKAAAPKSKKSVDLNVDEVDDDHEDDQD